MRRVLIASDHAGYAMKGELVVYLSELGYDVEDMGAKEYVPSDDYPDIITPCAQALAKDDTALAIILGASGQGEAMVANRTHGIRAAVFYGEAHAEGAIDAEGAPSVDGYDIVRLAREHNHANILSLGARFITLDMAKQAAKLFLETTPSLGERHARRVQKF